MVKDYIEVGVVGQPNVGKSTLFNVLTGRRVHVANWPGVTVEKHEGFTEYRGRKIKLVDLPGIYGFSATSLEEKIARKYILSKEPDVILVIVDSLNPERTMYLTIQTLEITPKVVIAFTKTDLTHAHGIHINYHALAHRLGVPAVPVSALTGTGFRELLKAIIDIAEGKTGRRNPLKIDYGELNPFIDSAVEILREIRGFNYPLRWLAVRLLEGDRELEEEIRRAGGEQVLSRIKTIREEIRRVFHAEPAELLSIKRFEFINKILDGILVRVDVSKPRIDHTRLFYHPVIGPLLSVLILIGIFTVAFTVNTGFPLNIILKSLGLPDAASAIEEYSVGGLMEAGLGILSDWLHNILGDNLVSSLLVDGIINGVGTVLTFLPLIMIVAFMLAVLEDSGLAPRIAVGIHNLLSKIGVSGHAIFPMTMGLGCNVPAIMATRAIPDYREKIRLTMTLPFIPCQARLVVILAFASALSGLNGALLILYGYLSAFIAFTFVNRLLYEYDKRKHGVKQPEILLELPPIHKPLWKVVWWHVWDSSKHFLIKAGTIIFLLSIITWGAVTYTPSLTIAESPEESIAASMAQIFAPLLAPIGLKDTQAWVLAFALLIGFMAKEAVIGSITVITGTDTVREAFALLGLTDTEIAALTVFTILYVPCMATLAVMYFETRSWKQTLLALALMMLIAYIGMLITYAIGSII